MHNRKGSRWSSCLDSDCLFPREQEATGMNSAVLTASLTGRIQFFYCVALLRTVLNCYFGLVCVHPPLVIDFGPETKPHRCGRESRSERGYEPPGAFAPCTSTAPVPAVGRSGESRADGGADLHAAHPNSRDSTPPAGSRSNVGLCASPRHSPYPRLSYCSVRANGRRPHASRAPSALSYLSTMTYRCHAGGCEGAVEKVGWGAVTPPR